MEGWRDGDDKLEWWGSELKVSAVGGSSGNLCMGFNAEEGKIVEWWSQELQNWFFTQRDPNGSRFARGIAHYLRSGKSVTNQAQYDTPGSPLMCPSIDDPWFPAAVFLPQPIAE